jgi:hypothetical protein
VDEASYVQTAGVRLVCLEWLPGKPMFGELGSLGAWEVALQLSSLLPSSHWGAALHYPALIRQHSIALDMPSPMYGVKHQRQRPIVNAFKNKAIDASFYEKSLAYSVDATKTRCNWEAGHVNELRLSASYSQLIASRMRRLEDSIGPREGIRSS